MSTVGEFSSRFNVEAPPFTASSASSRKSSTSTTQAVPYSASSATYSQSSTFNVQAPPFSAASSYGQHSFNVQAPPFSVPSSTFSVTSTGFFQGRPVTSAKTNPMNVSFYPVSMFVKRRFTKDDSS